MSFFWKLYLSIITITMLCSSVGGSILIQTSFQHSLQREVEDIYLENDIIISSLPLDSLQSWSKILEDNRKEEIDILQEVFSNMVIETFQGSLSFCVREESGKIIYQNGGFHDDKEIVKGLSENERGYMVHQSDNHYILRSLRVFSLGKTKLYIENTRDISSLFINRQDQLKTLLIYILLLSIISTIIIYVIARWLVSPVKKLTIASQKMTTGLSVDPVVVKGNDEIAQLARNFNTMTNRLSIMMHELQESVERQEVFVGNFAHELKTPLTSIIGYGDMLRLKRLSEEDIISYASLIVKEGKRLESMSMKLLELIVLKKQDFQMYHVSSNEFFQDIYNTSRMLMEHFNIDFIIDIEESDLYIEPDFMKTVCLNLLDNARKAVGQRGKIVLKGQRIQDGYRIDIVDNGCGIDKKEIDKITRAFYMIDKSRSRTQGGAGLGLAICEQIIAQHQAKMIFESEVGKGTTVSILLKGEKK